MIRLTSRVIDRREDIVPLERRVVLEKFFVGSTIAEEFKNIGNANPHTPNARASAALAFFNRDSIQSFNVHIH